MSDDDIPVSMPKLEELLKQIVARVSAPVDVPLLIHIERILTEYQKAVEHTAQNLEYRLESLNHWRAQSMEDRDLFLQRNVYNEMHGALLRRVEMIERTQARLQGVGLVFIATAGLIGAVLAHLFGKP